MADIASTTTAQPVEPGAPAAQAGTVLLTGGNNVKPWADTPYTLIGDTKAADPSHAHIPAKHYCKEMAYTMAQIHNTILRGVNSIYNQAANVKPGTQDCADFLFYNQCVYDFLHHHHMNEEESFFPLLRDLTGDATFCDVATKEHDLFDFGVGKWKEYIYNVNPEEYDGSKLKEIIEGFGTHLHQHLTAEIAWLLSMSKYDSDACKKAFLTTGKKAEAELTFQKDLPLILACQDATFRLDGRKGIFPPVPTPLLYLVKYFFAKRHASAWRFAPSDVFGKRKELPFA